MRVQLLASCCFVSPWFPIFGFDCLLPPSRSCKSGQLTFLSANFDNGIRVSAEVWQRRRQGTYGYGAGYSARALISPLACLRIQSVSMSLDVHHTTFIRHQ